MSETPKNTLTKTQVISMIACTILLLIYITLVTWVFQLEWFTLEWLMRNLEWAVALLAFGCVILFFFPILLGWQLKQKNNQNKQEQDMDAIPIISILSLVFAMILVGEIIKMKKDVRKLAKLSNHLKKDIETLKNKN